MDDRHHRLRALATAQWRIVLAAAMVAIHLGFVLLIAYNKPLLGKLSVPGVSISIPSGALVIVASWLLTWVWVWWANTQYDAELQNLRE
jgi:uncharacterized membrane protein (DUF485 family)